MIGKDYQINTELHSIVPEPTPEELQDIALAVYMDARVLPVKTREEVGRYLARLANSLISKEG